MAELFQKTAGTVGAESNTLFHTTVSSRSVTTSIGHWNAGFGAVRFEFTYVRESLRRRDPNLSVDEQQDEDRSGPACCSSRRILSMAWVTVADDLSFISRVMPYCVCPVSTLSATMFGSIE